MNRTILRQIGHQSVIVIILLAVSAAGVIAQERIPREFTNPDELISFDRQTSFPEAVDVIGHFSLEFEDRFMIDQTGYTGPIGVTLPPMHWKDALRYILRIHNMSLYEEPEFYEILTRSQLEERTREPGQEGRGVRPLSDMIATTKTREVRINATFFEGSRRALREVGVDWSTLTNDVPANITNYITEQGTERLPGQFDNRFVSVNATGAQSVSQNVFNSLINFGDVGAGIEVQALFSAFEADNLGEVLATPSIKVMEGEQGRIQVGEDFSIKQRDFAGNVTDQFFSTGTILTVTPQIIEFQDTTFIYVELEVERSSAQPDPVSTIISKEEASTHSLLLDGESTVIAGLYRTDQSEVRRGIPILKDLPPWFFGLRYLFGFNSTDVSQTELIVLVQAELEETIPNRIARQLQSKRELLELEQRRHREELDFVAGSGPEGGIFEQLPLPDEPVPVSSPDGSEQNGVEQELPEVMDREPLPAREPTVTETREIRQVQMTNVERQHAELRFYTIGGAFENRENAERLYRQFIENGYDAHLLHKNENDYYYVAYAGFQNREEAVQFTNRVQTNIQREAWLSVIETGR